MQETELAASDQSFGMISGFFSDSDILQPLVQLCSSMSNSIFLKKTENLVRVLYKRVEANGITKTLFNSLKRNNCFDL